MTPKDRRLIAELACEAATDREDGYCRETAIEYLRQRWPQYRSWPRLVDRIRPPEEPPQIQAHPDGSGICIDTIVRMALERMGRSLAFQRALTRVGKVVGDTIQVKLPVRYVPKEDV
jgi:hypothetical protein